MLHFEIHKIFSVGGRSEMDSGLFGIILPREPPRYHHRWWSLTWYFHSWESTQSFLVNIFVFSLFLYAVQTLSPRDLDIWYCFWATEWVIDSSGAWKKIVISTPFNHGWTDMYAVMTFPCSLSVVHFFFWLTLHYKYKSLPQDFSSLSKTCEETPSSDIRDREHPRQHLAFVPSLFPAVTVTACIWVSWREPPQVISSLSLSFALSFSLVQLLFLVSCTFHRLPLERGVRSTEQPSERKKKLKPCVVQESAPAWWAWSCCLQPSSASSPTCCSSSPTGSNWRPARSPPRSGSWGGSSEEAWLWVNQFHAESLVKCFIAHFYWVFQPLRFVV